MKKALALLSTLLFLLPFSIATLDQTCRRVTQADQWNYNFCITSLQVVPGSRTADDRGVAVIAAQLLQANYTSIVDKAKKLLNDKGLSPSMTKALGGCLNVYQPASQSLQTAVNKLRSFYVKEAVAYMRSAVGAPDGCALAFYQFRVKSPLLKENANARTLGNIALAIVALL